jgi:hypothetical protein
MQSRRALLASCVAVAVACSDAGPAAPAVPPGTYVLTAIGGRPLPLVVRVVSSVRSVALIEGALTLRGDGTFAATTTLYDGEVGVPGWSTRLPTEVAGRYRTTAGGVELDVPPGRTIRLVAAAVGRLRDPLAALPDPALDTLGAAVYEAR